MGKDLDLPPIEREDHGGGRGRYVMRFSGDQSALAELTFYDLANQTRVMDHTRVPKAHEGRGIAGLLTTRAVGDARAEGMSIRPDCSYVAAWLTRHP
jgi:uncharacterized protein